MTDDDEKEIKQRQQRALFLQRQAEANEKHIADVWGISIEPNDSTGGWFHAGTKRSFEPRDDPSVPFGLLLAYQMDLKFDGENARVFYGKPRGMHFVHCRATFDGVLDGIIAAALLHKAPNEVGKTGRK